MSEIDDLKRENGELRAYLKAFCAATVDPEDQGQDVGRHEANPFIEYEFALVDEGVRPDRTITGGQVRRAMELVGFDKLKIQPSDRTIADELTEARDLRREVKTLRSLLDDAMALLEVGPGRVRLGADTYTFLMVAKEARRQATFRAGDVVYHAPTEETWTVAYADPVRGDLAWCGWPDGAARLSDCMLVRAATDEQHRDVLREVIKAGGTRAAAAQRLYGNPDQDAQEAARG